MELVMLTRVIVAGVLVAAVQGHENASATQGIKMSVDITVPACVCPPQQCPTPQQWPTPLPPTRLATPTGSGYELFPGLGFYKFHAYGATWQQGQQHCIAEGTHLIVINSQREADMVMTLFSRYPTMPGAEQTGWAWTDVHEMGGNGNYVTTLGKPLTEAGFNIWAATEPNDLGPDDCVLTNRITAFLADAACTRLFAFICELEL